MPQCHAVRDHRLCSDLEFRIDSVEVDGVANEGTGVSAA